MIMEQPAQPGEMAAQRAHSIDDDEEMDIATA
jgi:hypothetical protein